MIDTATIQVEDTDARRPDRLFVSLYSELRRLARREVWRNGAHGILSTGSVVHEAWLDLSGRPALEFDQPGRFLGYAAQTMRGLVVDRLRAAGAQKRGGGLTIQSLDTHCSDIPEPLASHELEALADALEELASLAPDLAEVVDLKFFCGFTLGEIARMQGISERTAQRKWEKARLMLFSAVGA